MEDTITTTAESKQQEEVFTYAGYESIITGVNRT